jgi:glycosyltransferase involved in cell wall biosynthesis
MSMAVSVVIPTFRRTALLKRCLQAVLAQTLDPAVYEIIVVDDGASGETRLMVEEMIADAPVPSLRYLANEIRRGPAAARNRGWQEATGEIIAFTDDDCIPEPDWLVRGLEAFLPGTAGVSGRIEVPLGQKPTDYELNMSFLEHAEFATANCFYTRAALAAVNGFDERFTRAWREDADLFFTLLGRNELLRIAPEAVVVHPVRAGTWGISIREQSKSLFNALLFKKHRGLYRQRIRNTVLGHYHVIVMSALIFLLSLRPEFPPLAPAAFVVWAGATLSLFLKRLKGTSHSLSHMLEMALTSLVIPFLSLFWRFAGAVRFKVFYF